MKTSLAWLSILLARGARAAEITPEKVEKITAYMAEYERLADTPGEFGPYRGAVTTATRWSSYLSLVVPVGTSTTFSTVVYVQPRFDTFRDVRVLGETMLNVKIVDHLTTTLDVLVRHDSLPPSGVRPTDVTFTNGLSLSF